MNPEYSLMAQCADIVERDEPELWRVVCPRRYATPYGYANPRYNSGMLRMHIEMSQPNRPTPDKVGVDCILSCWSICNSMVPTYFVAKEFAEALVNTEPPSNMRVSELQWPHKGIVFVLPDTFQKQYFGRTVPFLRIASYPPGQHRAPEILQKIRPTPIEFGIDECKFNEMCFLITASVLFEGTPIEYSASFSDYAPLSEMIEYADFKDFTYELDAESIGIAESREMTPEDDRELVKKMINLAAHLLLAMNAVPEQIDDSDAMLYPAKTKTKLLSKVPPEKWVWCPKWIGRNYRHEREGASQGGTHASPRLHPRRGHWRNQPHGAGRTLKKLIWLRPMLIGAATKE